MNEIKRKKQDSINMKGIYYITKAEIQTPEQWNLSKQIDKLRSEGKEFIDLVRKLNSICKTKKMVFQNIIPTVARTMIANNLTNSSPTNSILVNYIALGTNNTAPDNANTTLETEHYRNAVASKTNSANIGYVSGFFNATECVNTYYEAGIFCDATATTDSGILLSRVLIDAPTGVVKTNITTLTIDWVLTIS